MGKEQDSTILEALRENGKRLFAFIRSRVREQEEAEDIYQDVLYELTVSYRMMQPIEKIAAWLFRVARNKITDKYRKKKPELLLDKPIYQHGSDDEPMFLNDLLAGNMSSPNRDFDQALIWEAIEMALDELPEEQREVFVRHEMEGISFQEMVDETGVALNTLLSRKRYAVLHLRERLQWLYDEIMGS